MAAYRIERDGNKCLVLLQEDLTASLIPDLQAGLKKELEHGVREVEFDLGNACMLDSSGIGLL